MMLSMGTFPINPVKKSSSVMLELIRRSAGSRIRVRASLTIQSQEGINKEKSKSRDVSKTRIKSQTCKCHLDKSSVCNPAAPSALSPETSQSGCCCSGLGGLIE